MQGQIQNYRDKINGMLDQLRGTEHSLAQKEQALTAQQLEANKKQAELLAESEKALTA